MAMVVSTAAALAEERNGVGCCGSGGALSASGGGPRVRFVLGTVAGCDDGGVCGLSVGGASHS